MSGAKGPPLLINGVKRPMPLVRILEVELYPTLLSKARSFGLSDEWIQVCTFFLFPCSSRSNIYGLLLVSGNSPMSISCRHLSRKIHSGGKFYVLRAV